MSDTDSSLYNIRYNQVTQGMEGFGGGSPMWTPLTLTADGGITQLTGIVTAGPGAGSQATQINLASAHLIVGNVSNVGTSVALSGDATLGNTGALTLATVNSNVGSFTNANITVDAKGRITAAANGSAGSSAIVAVHAASLPVEYTSGDATPQHVVESDLTFSANPAHALIVSATGATIVETGGQAVIQLWIDGVDSGLSTNIFTASNDTFNIYLNWQFMVTPSDSSSHTYSLYLLNGNTGSASFAGPGFVMIQEVILS